MFRDTLVKAAAAGVCGLLATGAASPAVARTQAGPSAPSVLRDYVALGDSYAAGPGIAPVEDEACGRSGANYASLLGERARRFTDVSCAGATTRDLYRRQNGDRPQIAALRSRASLVTLSIGGNDLGFTEIIQTCAQAAQTAPTGSPCKDYYAKDGSDALAKRMRGVAASVGKVLRDVKRRSPRAQVLLVGYPSLLPDDGSACRRAVPFAVGDFPYLRDTIKRLNAALARRPRAAASGTSTCTARRSAATCARPRAPG
ncbi:SGNH/GDSL hydrolase family protein [Thermocatellispora tengchongensis]|uniref:SGNH/GDSL hydrolase family protein n=1 Tax=Thermocatellispora tengchongensis TaxID=1073253 RepID=UPI00363DE8FF